jgi:hypothetical protein
MGSANEFSRRRFLGCASAAAVVSGVCALGAATRANARLPIADAVTPDEKPGRIVDMHIHFDEKNPSYIEDFLKASERLNLTALMHTPFANRKAVADAAQKFPLQIIPSGYVDMDAPDVVKQVQELHAMGYRGLGELEFVKKPYNDPSYFPVYELANQYAWVVMFHTGIVLREKFTEPENVASGRMRPIHLEEIARRFPKITVLGAHCGNPEYEWAAEIARWNPNVFFDLSGSSLTKMRSRLARFKEIFWWSGSGEFEVKTPDNDPSAFVKLVFGSDSGLDGIDRMIGQYRALFDACEVPERTRKLIMGGTLSKLLELPA